MKNRLIYFLSGLIGIALIVSFGCSSQQKKDTGESKKIEINDSERIAGLTKEIQPKLLEIGKTLGRDLNVNDAKIKTFELTFNAQMQPIYAEVEFANQLSSGCCYDYVNNLCCEGPCPCQ